MRGKRVKKIRKFAVYFTNQDVKIDRKFKKVFKKIGKKEFESRVISLIHEFKCSINVNPF